MIINDLDFLFLAPQGNLLGAASASATGNTFAQRGFADANADGAAQGQQISIFTYTATNVINGNPHYNFSHALAEANAFAQDQNSYANANYFSNSTYTSFLGSSTTRDLMQSTSLTVTQI